MSLNSKQESQSLKGAFVANFEQESLDQPLDKPSSEREKEGDNVIEDEADAAVLIDDLRVDYEELLAVDHLSLEVKAGQIYGLVGPNGAGKTSTFKVITTLLKPTYGSVKLCGVDIFEQAEAAHHLLGYMPDLAPVPSDLRVEEFLALFARAHGLEGVAAKTRIQECLVAVELEQKKRAWCRDLSRGMMQRLVLAKTLLHKPPVMILDEPASGMDPRSRVALRNSLRAMAAQGVAVLVSSHILSELAEMCTHLGVLKKGKLLASGTVEEILSHNSPFIPLRIQTHAKNQEQLRALLEGNKQVKQIKVLSSTELSIQFHGTESEQQNLLESIIQARIPLQGFLVKQRSLEDLVLELDEEQE